MDTSRRNFLKASTATGLLAMTYAPGTLGAVGAKALEGGDRSVFSFCEMCSSRCPIEAKVVDGTTVFIQGNGDFRVRKGAAAGTISSMIRSAS